MEETRRNVKVGQLLLRIPMEELAELDRLVAERSVGGVTASRQSIGAAMIARCLKEARRPR